MEKLKPDSSRDDGSPASTASSKTKSSDSSTTNSKTLKATRCPSDSASEMKMSKSSASSSSKKLSYPCVECGTEFDDSKKYRNHLLLAHKCFSCEFCSKTFASLFLMVKHKDQEHPLPKSSSPSLPDAFAALSMTSGAPGLTTTSLVTTMTTTATKSTTIASKTTSSSTKTKSSSSSNTATASTSTTTLAISSKPDDKEDKKIDGSDEDEGRGRGDVDDGAEEEEIRTKLKCGVCEETLFSKSSLEKHFQVSHGALADKFYRCSDCNAVFLSKDLVKTHRKKEHAAGSPVKMGGGGGATIAGRS